MTTGGISAACGAVDDGTMLRSLSIRDMVLIETLDVEFRTNFISLTGETGAGKSVILAGLKLALGERGDSRWVRPGASQAQVSAIFEATVRVQPWLEEQGLAEDEGSGQVIVRRHVSGDGRSRAWINDRPVGLGLLRTLGEMLAEIQGQFESHSLLDSRRHRDILDAFAGCKSAVRRCGATYEKVRSAEKALAALEAARHAVQEEEEYLRHCVAELSGLEEGEMARLEGQRARLKDRGKIETELREALGHLNGEDGAGASVDRAQRRLERIAEHLPEAWLEDLARTANSLVALTDCVEGLLQTVDTEGEDGALVEERYFALRALERKHDCTGDELLAVRDRMETRLGLLDDGAQAHRDATAALAEAREAWHGACSSLTAQRQTGAQALEARVNRELPHLKLEHTSLHITIKALPEDQCSGQGCDDVVFMACTNPGHPAGPLHQVASGGELSRFLLALKVALSELSPGLVLVFDEVDQGIGGGVAHAVGQHLRALSEGQQIVLVTHSPQVAALAGEHLKVEKHTTDGRTVSVVESMSGAVRLEEVARMLSGAEITQEAREAARQLLP